VAIRDAIIVSLVGMGVVFSGLLLTSWLISAISLVPAWLERRRRSVQPPPAPAVKEMVPALIVPAPPPAVAAVIAALLEVEMRLHGGDLTHRFTFRRDPVVSAWRSESGKRSDQPNRGVR
jgi:Na+-transporting methylmalonyl-CoA/oxaloacetate decarboxylase gamma subunit